MGVLVSSVTPTARAGAGELPPATPACGFRPFVSLEGGKAGHGGAAGYHWVRDTAIKSIKNPKTDPCEREILTFGGHHMGMVH